MIFRVVFGFAGMGKGWAETHAMLNGGTKPSDPIPTLRDIATKRAQMLGREYSIVAIRVSRYATEAGARVRGSFLLKEVFKNSVTTATAAAEPAEVALIVRGAAEPSLINPAFDANVNQTFLGAPLDVCVDNAGVVDRGKGGLDAAFLAWRAVMLSTTMGWLANETILNTELTAIAANANGTVKFTTLDAAVGPLVQGQKYKCRVRGVNNGVSPLNGETIVRCTGVNEVTSVRPIAFAGAPTGGAIRVYKQVQPFVDYGDLTMNGLVGNHKKGRPFGSTPGRARRRARA